jgi:hypothetical protein
LVEPTICVRPRPLFRTRARSWSGSQKSSRASLLP